MAAQGQKPDPVPWLRNVRFRPVQTLSAGRATVVISFMDGSQSSSFKSRRQRARMSR